MLEPTWRDLQAASGQAREVATAIDEPAWLDSAHTVLDRWFILEDPTRLEPAEREAFVEADARPPDCSCAASSTGWTRPGRRAQSGGLQDLEAPPEAFELRALFQLRIYALIMWRSRGVVPGMLQLVYLGATSEIVRYEPDEADLLATERKVDAVWEAIELAKATGEFLPHRGKQCDWCAFKAHCPAWGGELLPMPAPPSRWAELRRSVRRRWRRLRRRLRHR